MGRADIKKKERVPFTLYMDEFQSFTNVGVASYEMILSRARKFRLRLVLAHQQTKQIPGNLLAEILGNVSTIIGFDISADDANKLSKEFLTANKGKVENMRKENFLNLRVGQAFCRIGKTSMKLYVPNFTEKGNPSILKQIVKQKPSQATAKNPIKKELFFHAKPEIVI